MPVEPVTVETILQGYRLSTDHGSVAFCGVNLIEGRDGAGALTRILVDTGHTGRRPSLTRELARRGLSPDDIDIVVCTHAHWDHIENLDVFERAQIVLHRNERRYIKHPHRNDHACPEWIDAIFERYQERIREVEEGVRLIDGVEIVDAPGHSAGTIAVAATTGEGMAVVTGDAVQNSLVAVERKNVLVFWSDAEATRTIDKLVTLADVIYPGHDQAFRLGGNNKVEYVQDFQLRMTGLGGDEPGLSFDPGLELRQEIMPGIEEQRLA
ncbi:MAG TPA: MBL fold metallo-hydrolase [Acidimicrobiales bacterium]|nr:MBL fold metallo-hydrolase [Acidimicrobiales bacterium]